MEERRLARKADTGQSIVPKCACPYCEEELLTTNFPYCRPCSVSLRYCASCKVVLPREAEVCPHCGAEAAQ